MSSEPISHFDSGNAYRELGFFIFSLTKALVSVKVTRWTSCSTMYHLKFTWYLSFDTQLWLEKADDTTQQMWPHFNNSYQQYQD